MAHIPTAPTALTVTTAGVEQHFRHLEGVWTAETAHLSSSSRLVAHPAFREIVGMGPAVVPLMLRDLAHTPSLWVWALPEITGVDPVAATDRGDVSKMAEAWVRWGLDNGYRW